MYSAEAWGEAIVVAIVAWRALRGRSLVGLALVYGFLAFGAAAVLFYSPRPADFIGEYAVSHYASQTNRIHYFPIFIVAAAAVGAGAYLATNRSRGRTSLIEGIRLRLPPQMVALGAIPLILDVYGTGWHTVFHAPAYLFESGPHVAEVLGRGLGPLGVLISAFFALDRKTPIPVRIFGSGLAVAYELVYLGAATRLFAIWPALIFVAALLVRTWSRTRRTVWVTVMLVAAVVFDQIPLGLRSLPNHGLVGALGYLTTAPSQVFGGHNLVGNTLFGAPLTYYIQHVVPPLPTHYVATALNPLPSGYTDWGTIQQILRVNSITPFSALGELLNHGWMLYIVVLAFFGALFAWAERLALRATASLRGTGTLLTLGLAGIFMIQSTEYNLRSVARLAYYAVAGVAILRWPIRSIAIAFKTEHAPSSRAHSVSATSPS